MRVVFVLMCACNPVFGLEPTERRDAHPIDAPLACPTSGAPVFSPTLHQLVQRDCEDFVALASGFTMATCRDGAVDGNVFEGTSATTLVPTRFKLTGNDTYLMPRPSPDGMLLVILHEITYPVTMGTFEQYHRDGGDWVLDGTLPFGNISLVIGTLGRGEDGAYRAPVAGPTGIDEYIYEGGWTLVGSHSASELGLQYINYAALTEDALHMLVTATAGTDPRPHVYFASRAHATDAFGPLTVLDNVPATTSPYLTTDCARIYVSGLEAVFFTVQQ